MPAGTSCPVAGPRWRRWRRCGAPRRRTAAESAGSWCSGPSAPRRRCRTPMPFSRNCVVGIPTSRSRYAASVSPRSSAPSSAERWTRHFCGRCCRPGSRAWRCQPNGEWCVWPPTTRSPARRAAPCSGSRGWHGIPWRTFLRACLACGGRVAPARSWRSTARCLRPPGRRAGTLRRLPQRAAGRARQRRPRSTQSLAGGLRRAVPGPALPAGAVRLRSRPAPHGPGNEGGRLPRPGPPCPQRGLPAHRGDHDRDIADS